MVGGGAPESVQGEGLQPYGALDCFEWRPKGTGGNEGKRVPSGHNRRRRLATRSSGKQQAGRTAVRTAPIVCPEESPQCARRRIPPALHAEYGPKGVQGGERKATLLASIGDNFAVKNSP